MIRQLVGQIVSMLVIGGFLVGWWLAAGQDFGVMLDQGWNLLMTVGSWFRPVIEKFTGSGA